MEKQKLAVFLGVSFIFLIIAAIFYADFLRPRSFYDTGIGDEEYIRIASQTVEAQKFLEKYPNATSDVDRSGRLAVDYRVDKHPAGNATYLRLRVFINWRTNQPAHRFIDCSGTYTKENILEYLETESCLD